MSRYSMLLGVCVALGLNALAPPSVIGAGGARDAGPGRAGRAQLTRVASRLSERAGVVTIEATDPVAYVTAQPDPRTFVVELRDVVAGRFADRVETDPRQPFSAVRVESARAADGTDLARVRLTLSQPQRPRVRSTRNVIVVEAERADAAPAAPDRSVPTAPTLDPVAALLSSPRQVLVAAPASPSSPPVLLTPVRPQQAPSPAPAVQAPAPPAPSRFTGHAVTLDFQGADLRAVLRTFSEISGLNVVLDATIQGSVDVALRDVPWDQALDIILRANKLGYVVDGTIVRIAPLTVLAEEEAQRQRLLEAQAESGELRVLTRALSYAKAEDLVALLTATALSKRGSIQTDQRTNTIIVNDLADRLARAEDLLTTLDRPQPQVEIEARIVQTTREFARELGVRWGGRGRATAALGNTLPTAFPNQVEATAGVGLGTNKPATSAVGLVLGSINGALNLDVALSALEDTKQGRILSTPRVSTQNNVEAEIMQGFQFPIQTVANNTVTITFKDAALTLRVLPQITASDTVIMRIMVENSIPGPVEPNGNRSINTQRATTQVLVASGETTVIGGIYTSNEQTSQGRTPALYRIPLLGWLFKNNALNDASSELMIFITPKISKL